MKILRNLVLGLLSPFFLIYWLGELIAQDQEDRRRERKKRRFLRD